MEKPYTNTSKKVEHIGGKRFMPNETRPLDEKLHPDYKPPAKPADPVVDVVAELHKADVKDIVGQLPNLADEDLVYLKELEEGRKSKSRKTVLEAIAAQQIERAQADSKGNIEEFVANLEKASDEELAELEKLHADDQNLLDHIEKQKAQRAAAAE